MLNIPPESYNRVSVVPPGLSFTGNLSFPPMNWWAIVDCPFHKVTTYVAGQRMKEQYQLFKNAAA